jgi:5'-3' exonuclease
MEPIMDVEMQLGPLVTPTLPTTDATILVDGDIVAYRAAAAANGNGYVVMGPGGLGEQPFKYMKEAKAFCDKEGIDYSCIFPTRNPEPVENAIHSVKEIMKGIYAKTLGPVIVYTSCDGKKFRDEIYPEYKMNRVGMERPVHLVACKDYLIRHYPSEVSCNCEADDCISITAKKLRDRGKEYIICSIDKDLHMISGRHYNWVTGEEREICEGEALVKFYRQLLMGDKTDNIPGIKGLGPKTAEKIIPFPGDYEPVTLYRTVLNNYIGKTPREEGEDDLTFYKRVIQTISRNARLLWLQQVPEEVWQPPTLT